MSNGILAGFRIVPNTMPRGILTADAIKEVLESKTQIFALHKTGVAVPGTGAATLVVADATAPSTTGTVPGLVNVAAEPAGSKHKANVGLLAANGDKVMSANNRQIWGRITSYTGAGPYNYTITFYDDADQNVQAPTSAVNWPAGVVGPIVVELPWRKRLSDLDELESRTKWVGLNSSERDQEIVDDVTELYAKTGIVEGVANDYANSNYIADGDTFKVAIGKLDAQLLSTNNAITANNNANTASINDLYAKSGISAAGANNYANNNYVVDGATLLASISVLDGALKGVDNRLVTAESRITTNGKLIENETPAGVIAANQLTFTLANTPIAGSLALYMSFMRLTPTTHYTIAGNTITYVAGFEPQPGESHRADYRTAW